MRSREEWQPAGAIELEPSALAAVKSTDSNLVVVAGPGTGKTELLAQRADFLLRTGACHYPRRILAISFKVDAARNLRQRISRRCSPEQAARVDSYTFHAFAKHLIDVFRPLLQGEQSLPENYSIGKQAIPYQQLAISDMVSRAKQIVEHSDVARRAIAHTYEYVFLDEFQDCTEEQYEFLRAAIADARARVIAVGDTKQSIMQWAGALEGIFERYLHDFGVTEPSILYVNHRADPLLRRMQNAMVLDMDPAAAVSPTLLDGDGGVVEVHHFVDELAEARALAERIAEWVRDSNAQVEIAVLVRNYASTVTLALQRELQIKGVPFRTEEAIDEVVNAPIARLLTDLLHVVSGGRRPDAYTRLFDAAEAIWSVVEESEERAAKLRHEVDHARRRLARDPEVALNVLTRPFLDVVGATVLSALVREQDQSSEDVVTLVLEMIEERRRSTGSVLKAVDGLLGYGAVRIMTIHKAKGMEFNQVVVLGVEAEFFRGVGRELNEERATFFVAISRARHELHLTTAERRSEPPGARYWKQRRNPRTSFLAYAAAVGSQSDSRTSETDA